MNLQHLSILETAARLGIEITELDGYGEPEAALLCFNGQEELVVNGYFLSQLNLQNKEICGNKQLTKHLFSKLAVPSPDSLAFHDPLVDKIKIDAFWKPDTTYVCKPLNGAEGKGVVMNLSSPAGLEAYWREWGGHYDAYLLEEQKQGYDLRLQAIGGKLAAACIRKPAFVTGDGSSTVGSLVETRQAIIKQQNPSNRLSIDKTMLGLLQAQGLFLKSVPEKDQTIQLGQLANMSLGAVAMDVTKEIDPLYKSWVERISRETGMTIFALDVVTANHEVSMPGKDWGIEINSLPDWLHHTFSEVRRHDIAGMIIRDIFRFSNP